VLRSVLGAIVRGCIAPAAVEVAIVVGADETDTDRPH
jgi:hypothetical protein